jgi:thymidylate synthase
MGFMNKLDKTYTDLLQDILDNGTPKSDRTGTGTISVFGRQIRHKMSEGFPLLTTKKMPWKSIVTELLWFLQGNTNIKWLVDNGCNIWNGDAYKNYKNKTEIMMGHGFHGTLLSQEEFIERIKTDDEFSKQWGELGPIYGGQWRDWKGFRHGWHDVAKVIDGSIEPHIDWLNGIDQITNLIYDLKTNPDSRRLMVNAWNVGELDQMVLPPCHYGFQVYTRELSLERRYNIWFNNNYETGMERFFDPNNLPDFDNPYYIPTPTRAISLMWNQRSVDTFLGLPFNIASYGLLLEIIAKEVNMVPDELIGNLGDVHLYSNHIEQANEQIGRKYTHEERTELLKQAMGEERYNKAVDELMPFGGGLSEYYDSYKIPNKTREPYKLPTFDCPAMDEIPYTTFDELVFKLQPADFYMDDYVSHPTIKAPLSN